MKARIVQLAVAVSLVFVLISCGGGGSSSGGSTTGSLTTGGSTTGTSTTGGTTSGTLAAVSTWQYTNARYGANIHESLLTTSVVNSTTFGKLFTDSLDSKTEGQPLYIPKVMVKGALHNVVFVATLNNSVYAFDADKAGAPLWKINFGPAPPLGTEDAGNENPDGILSTPVIKFSQGSTSTGVIYVCSKTYPGGVFTYKLHGLDISTGTETAGGPVTIRATVNGKQGPITLDVKNSYQRPALLLNDNIVYVAIGGQLGDPLPDRGWIFGYNASSLLQRVAVFTTCPDLVAPGGSGHFIGGSIWMSGAGLVSDGSNIYVTTGNGDFNANAGGSDFGDTMLKLSPGLRVEDYFTPSNQLALEESDLDVGCGGPVLIPPQGGSPTLLVQLSKTNAVYVADTHSMGGFNAGGDKIYQELAIGQKREYLCTPAYYNGFVYMARQSNLQSFGIRTGKLASAPSATAPTAFGGYLPTPTISCGARTTPIVWAIQESGASAVLHAYSAITLAELYNSNSARDAAGGFAKFALPSVANGKVYVPCSNELAVYGLLSQKAADPAYLTRKM